MTRRTKNDAPPREGLPVLRIAHSLRGLQGRPHAWSLHHRPRQDFAEPVERHVRAPSAAAVDGNQTGALSRADSVHQGPPPDLSMADGLAPAPRERGWARLAFALAAFLLVPLFPAVRAVLPVENTLILLVPSIAVCFLLGWWAGGRLSLALVWLMFAAWVLAQPAPDEGGSYYDLARAWGLLLAGAFGVTCILGKQGPFFTRVLSAIGLALLVGLAHGVAGRTSFRRVESVLDVQYEVRNRQSIDALSVSLRNVAQRF